MDYTDRPWTNTGPDAWTFELLEDLYGNPNLATDDDSMGGGDVVSSESGSTYASLRGDASATGETPTNIPDAIKQRAKEAASNLESKFSDKDSNEDWVQLHRDDNSAAFQIELGDGYSLQAFFLLAKPDDRRD